MTTETIGSRMPALSAEIALLLGRMDRPDLAAQMQVLRVLGEHTDRGGRRRTFLAADGVRRYSIEMEAAQCVIVLDVDIAEQILALHVSTED